MLIFTFIFSTTMIYSCFKKTFIRKTKLADLEESLYAKDNKMKSSPKFYSSSSLYSSIFMHFQSFLIIPLLFSHIGMNMTKPMSILLSALPLFCLPYINFIFPLFILPLLSSQGILSLNERDYWLMAQGYNILILIIILCMAITTIIVKKKTKEQLIYFSCILLKHNFTSIMYTLAHSINQLTKDFEVLSCVLVVSFILSIPFMIYIFYTAFRDILLTYTYSLEGIKVTSLVPILNKDLRNTDASMFYYLIFGIKSFISILIILAMMLAQNNKEINTLFILLFSTFIIIEIGWLFFLL